MNIALQGTAHLDAPFPGLRAFEADESLLFYGREAHVAELLNRLGDNRFVAVTGTSGSGKSSLVRAGLRPALQRGYLVDSTSRWRFATLRPGSTPIEALARAVAGALDGQAVDDITRSLRATSAGLSEAVARANLAAGESLLVIADQFEELFRFDVTRDQQANAALFVSLLLEATERHDPRIYVVVTMRSEFLGRCSEFTGLAEAFNRSQYLVPRLTRDERREAIERPLRLFDTTAAPALVQQVLNDAGDDPDQLPVLQHVLLRTYRKWEQSDGRGRIEREHYDAIGGIGEALDRHGEEILTSLSESAQRTTERLFRSLTVSQGGIALRRPRRLRDLYDIVGIDEPEDKPQLDALVKTFASRDHSFLMLSSPQLGPDTVVDITHESLIRKWKRLGQWVRDETRSAEWFADLSRDVVRYRQHEVGPWEDPELAGVQQRRRAEGWNEAWAKQYSRPDDPSFSDVLAFLDESTRLQTERQHEEEEQRNRELRQAQALASAKRRQTVVLAMLVVGVAVIAFIYYRLSVTQREFAEVSQQYAAAAEKSAADQTRLAALLQEQAQLSAQAGNQTSAPAAGGMTVADKARMDQLTQEIERVRQQAKGSEDQLAKLKNAQDATAADRGGLQQRVDALQQQLSQATAERDKLQGQVATLQPQLSSATAERDRLQTQVNTLQNAARSGDAAPTLQRQLEDERAKSTQEIARLNAEIATLRKASSSNATGASTATTPDIERAYTAGVRAYDLGNWQTAARSMQDAIRMQQVGAQPPKQVQISGNRLVPYAPQSYLGAALYEMKTDCATVVPVLNAAGVEPKAQDVQRRLEAAHKQCPGQ